MVLTIISGDLWGAWYTDDDHWSNPDSSSTPRPQNITNSEEDKVNIDKDALFDKDDIEKAKREAQEAADQVKDEADAESVHADENGYI